MNIQLRTLMISTVLGLSLLLTACGGSTSSSAATAIPSTGPVTLELGSAGDNLAFNKTALTVFSGQQVTIKFTDNSTALQHNWVLVKGGDDLAQQVATEGLVAGADKNYLPTDPANIIANTPLSNAGQTVETSFTAPAPGTYTYFCTVPGHYPLMKGTLTVN
ncbi:auracyanin [Chloroflexales bacterium ZM16-3]|nr:auracyanin [Chloroflexales bacterium ZM16-3]